MATPRPRGMSRCKDGLCAEGRLMARPLFFISLEPYPGSVLSGWPSPSFHKFRLQMARRALMSHQSGRPHRLVKARQRPGMMPASRIRACGLGPRGRVGLGGRASGAEGAAGGQDPAHDETPRSARADGRAGGCRRTDYPVNGSLVGRAKARSALSSITARSILR